VARLLNLAWETGVEVTMLLRTRLVPLLARIEETYPCDWLGDAINGVSQKDKEALVALGMTNAHRSVARTADGGSLRIQLTPVGGQITRDPRPFLIWIGELSGPLR
jgi:hypothetical protein